jgi:capsular exopolysaccharide synthesis family protein
VSLSRLTVPIRRRSIADKWSSETLVTATYPGSLASEAYRTLRTNVIYGLSRDSIKVIVITSPRVGEGKSIICGNLGVSLAQANRNTLVLDCDFRKPTMHKIFGTPNLVGGVTNVLAGDCGLSEAGQQVLPSLRVMPGGPTPPNPTELLGSKSFSELLDQARRAFDYVLVDTPPAQVVSDPIVVAAQGDGVLLVLDSQRTSKRSVRQLIQSVEAVEARVLGTIMNNVRNSDSDTYHRYGYAYTY